MGLFDEIDVRAEIEKGRQELGSPGRLAGIWAGVAVVFGLVDFVLGGIPGGFSAFFSILIEILLAFPVAAIIAWLVERRSKT